jgi:hypothetical protein
MSLFTDGLPAWWAMVVAVAALLAGVLLGELHGRGVGRGQVREDRAAERAARQVRSWRAPATREEAMARRTHPVYRQRRTSTAAFLNPPEVAHEDPGMTLAEADEYWAGVAHEAITDLASCGHPANEDGECNCAYWPERAQIPQWPGFDADQQAHLAWLAHCEQAMDLANGTVLAPEDQALLDELVAGLDAWRAANL